MRNYNISPDANGNGSESDFINRVLERIMKELQFYNSGTISWEQTARGIRANVINPTFGTNSPFPWQQPKKELDPTVAVAINTFVYISQQNPLVSPGLVDLVSGNITMSRPGIWQAVQAVPAKNGANKYNVPQTPLPGAGGVPSGTPLSGDADGANVFWLFWAPVPYC